MLEAYIAVWDFYLFLPLNNVIIIKKTQKKQLFWGKIKLVECCKTFLWLLNTILITTSVLEILISPQLINNVYLFARIAAFFCLNQADEAVSMPRCYHGDCKQNTLIQTNRQRVNISDNGGGFEILGLKIELL